MAYRQTNTKLKTYFKTDRNNKNIFRSSHLTLSWRALHAAIKDNQNNLDSLRLVIYKLFSCFPNIPRGFITPVNS